VKKIYVASSWRNQQQQEVVRALRARGNDVYDFKNPPGRTSFSWKEIDPNWEKWTVQEYMDALYSREAEAGFKSDMDALRACDVCVYVLPCGRSASLELGWACGAGKFTIALLADAEPELMIKMCDYICKDIEEVIGCVRLIERRGL
jgi:nucleoside 2-deoxyribosyltransferase